MALSSDAWETLAPQHVHQKYGVAWFNVVGVAAGTIKFNVFRLSGAAIQVSQEIFEHVFLNAQVMLLAGVPLKDVLTWKRPPAVVGGTGGAGGLAALDLPEALRTLKHPGGCKPNSLQKLQLAICMLLPSDESKTGCHVITSDNMMTCDWCSEGFPEKSQGAGRPGALKQGEGRAFLGGLADALDSMLCAAREAVLEQYKVDDGRELEFVVRKELSALDSNLTEAQLAQLAALAQEWLTPFWSTSYADAQPNYGVVMSKFAPGAVRCCFSRHARRRPPSQRAPSPRPARPPS